jgi:hypothetical protein
MTKTKFNAEAQRGRDECAEDHSHKPRVGYPVTDFSIGAKAPYKAVMAVPHFGRTSRNGCPTRQSRLPTLNDLSAAGYYAPCQKNFFASCSL